MSDTIDLTFDWLGAIQPSGGEVYFEGIVSCDSPFQSMEIATFCDGQRAYDLTLGSFFHDQRDDGTYFKFEYLIPGSTNGHSYRLDGTLHFLAAWCVLPFLL